MNIQPFRPLDELLRGLVLDPAALQSTQCKCLSKYLTELKTQSAILEDDYNDAGYLAEYANYYSRCHDEFDRFTLRVHFFSESVDVLKKRFEKSLVCEAKEDDEQQINEAYLGFVVIKPLPKTIIGRTCLKPYPELDENSGRYRHFPIVRTYTALLYGLRLSVNSIAFQEQDNEVAACSTAAIWYALHALTRKVTSEEIASTYEITNHASLTYVKRSLGEVARRFPSSGLGLEQIEAYLRSIGMECIVCGATLDKTSAQAAEYLAAYASDGFPMILVGNLYVGPERDSRHRKLGLHAMTALAYAIDPKFAPGNKASRIRRIFAHDDNVGPFASYALVSCEKGAFTRILANGKAANRAQDESADEIAKLLTRDAEREAEPTSVEQGITGYLANESGLASGGIVYRKFTPEYFIIPVHHKVRFPYEGIALFAQQVEEAYKTKAPLRYAPGSAPPQVSWSVALRDVRDFKSKLRRCSTMDPEAIIDLLYLSLPKNIWVLSFWTEASERAKSPILDFHFDATALRQSGGLIGMTPYDKLPEAETFMSIVSAHLQAYDENQLAEMDSELQPIMRAARNFILESLRAEREAMAASGAASSV